jgi:hypothetical protein
VRSAILFLLILLTACAGERRTIGKGWVAQRDNRPHKERRATQRVAPRSAAFERPPAPEQRIIEDASASVGTDQVPASAPLPPPDEAADVRVNDDELGQSPALADPQALQEAPPERTKWNWWAPISTLVLIGGLAWAISLQSTELLIVFGAIAFVIALIAARQCRDKGLKGQGFALITMYLAGVTFLVGLLAFIGRFR